MRASCRLLSQPCGRMAAAWMCRVLACNLLPSFHVGTNRLASPPWKPEPSSWVTITWGVLLGGVAAALLVVGGATALQGLQSIMIVTALPFALVIIGIMIAWAKDLRTDPYVLRGKYARAAIQEGVRKGIADHGDDFVFGTSEVPAGDGAGAWLDSEDPALTEWYVEAATGPIGTVTAEDVRRTLDPGHIQHKGPDRPDHAASGDNALTVNEDRRAHRRAREEASED